MYSELEEGGWDGIKWKLYWKSDIDTNALIPTPLPPKDYSYSFPEAGQIFSYSYSYSYSYSHSSENGRMLTAGITGSYSYESPTPQATSGRGPPVQMGTLANGAEVGMEYFCLRDGCYDFNISQSSDSISWQLESAAVLVIAGGAPATSYFCAEEGAFFGQPSPAPTITILPSSQPTPIPR